jgi:hypothetical protein
MARREQVFAGYVVVNGERLHGEVWVEGAVAVVFATPANTVVATVGDAVLGIDDTGRLTVTGLDADGAPVSVVAEPPERAEGRWLKATVTSPEGRIYTNATVTWSNYRVTVRTPGAEPVEFVAAKARTVGRATFIELADGTTLPVTLAKRGCGCGKRS